MAGMSDPLNFTKAEDYFNEAKSWTGPKEIVEIIEQAPSNIEESGYWRGITLKFDDGTFCVVQFVRPSVWRVRYDPSVTKADDYGDENSRTIVGDYTSTLIKNLDLHSGITWETKLGALTDGYWIFESKVISVSQSDTSDLYHVGDSVQIYLYKKPFRIQVTRTLKPLEELYPIPVISAQATARIKVIWQTSPETFRYKRHATHDMLKDVVIDVVKAGHGEFIGFGEQGGTSFAKKPTFMNYFNMDNMQYQQVYSSGPLDPREPLYHSDPFWLDVNSNPEHMSVVASFLDNYSQIAVDFGKTNAGYIKIGTRYGTMDYWGIAADTVPKIVRLYTGLVGRSSLKPRYILGNHQACYGYMNKEDLHTVTNYYRSTKIPFDGLHIDVDFQNNFRTFTTNPRTFSNPKEMFDQLRAQGVKCSTNITPVISLNDLGGDGYQTLREGKEKGYFITDDRYKKEAPPPEGIEYVCYGGGNKFTIPANDVSRRPWFTDDNGNRYQDNYQFVPNYDNTSQPYHGGVSYGYDDGTPGFYPDLNRPEVRDWWGQQYKYLFDMGLEFVWQDMTTPAIHESYGDMKGLPTRLWVNSDAVSSRQPVKKLAIEIWALFAYNLHKATFHGLNKLESRKGKRNFILGRGSFAGMYRYAGLWSGDNASTWDFWKICISQVLSVGLNGVCISGADVGGFEPFRNPITKQEEKYCNPELLIRWYSGSYMLPWLRNHYVQKADKQTGDKRKWFQEPYAYPIHFENMRKQGDDTLKGQAWLYYGVQYITQYYIQLRYSLMQLLYDTMFENQVHGLPIARSMLLTDTQDTSFFNESQQYLDDQYVIGKDLLIAPIMHSRSESGHEGENRDVYLPLGYFWYPSNLRPMDNQGVALGPAAEGGSVINYTAKIPQYPDHPSGEGNEPKPDPNGYPYVTPTYIREGGIIPQIGVRDYIGDGNVNHIKFNIYPHRLRYKSEYTTYLDDGVSRSSAPKDAVRFKQIQKTIEKRRLKAVKSAGGSKKSVGAEVLDDEAKDEHRVVTIHQETTNGTRTITIKRKLKEVDYDPIKELGSDYTIICWYEQEATVGNYTVTVTPTTGGTQSEIFKDVNMRTVVVKVKETLGASEEVVIKVVPN